MASDVADHRDRQVGIRVRIYTDISFISEAERMQEDIVPVDLQTNKNSHFEVLNDKNIFSHFKTASRTRKLNIVSKHLKLSRHISFIFSLSFFQILSFNLYAEVFYTCSTPKSFM
ncbi:MULTISPECIES: hypothetical protein [unclassified Endozoicomonas]|uniref:hypothetical protein n=1 Tax=unclassified Endozoicomonas TaxID=2644528 RepID=UPI002147960E|nr:MULTISPECIES: hypothetical protein [unclassified Endozoicomonas]